MNCIKQHHPSSFSGLECATVEFSTIEELLNIGFVKNFAKNWGNFIKFSHFAYHKSDEYRKEAYDIAGVLMAVYDKVNSNKRGTYWLVVGKLKEDVNLQKWTPVYED